MNQVEERIKILPTETLLEIIVQLKGSNQRVVLAILEAELSRRDINKFKINELIRKLDNKKDVASTSTADLNELFNGLLLPNKNSTYKLWIKAICIYLSIGYLIYSIVLLKITYSSTNISDSSLLFWLFIPLVYVPFCIYFLWKFKKIGWEMATIFFGFSFWIYLIMSLSELTTSLTNNNYDGLALYNNYNPLSGIIFAQLIISSFILNFMNKTEILELYQIASKQLLRLILFFLIVIIAFFGSIFLV